MTSAGSWPSGATPTPRATTPWPAVRESPPALAVVECDGGRIRTREPGHGPGVHRTARGLARDKERLPDPRPADDVSTDDPQPEPPACFCDPKHVAKIAETEALSVAAAAGAARRRDRPETPEPAGDPPPTWQPQRLVRTVLSSLAGVEDVRRPDGARGQTTPLL